MNVSSIRKGKYRPATPTNTATSVSRSDYTPWILKRVVLESSGRILISSNSKTNRIKNGFRFFCDVFFYIQNIWVLRVKKHS